jgi:DNA-binding beta-propeller fold protein YncE
MPLTQKVLRSIARSSAIALFACLCAAPAPVEAQQPPKFKVDADWPLELPDNWILGQVGGLAVDSHDHIWVLQRPGSDTADELGAAQTPQRSLCCFAAKPVLEFDKSGKLLNAWGGPAPAGAGYDWPKTEHGIHVDKNDNVWIGGNAADDRMVLKFTRDGRFLMRIGKPSTDPVDSARTDILGRPAGIDVDEAAHEVYIADGYANKRVIVFDSDTGAFKRLWGAYGNKPSDADPGAYSPGGPPAQQFRNPVHCVHIAEDGLVYVCDRLNNRIQVFTKQGKFVKEFSVRPETLGNGSAWDLAFSRDKGQSFLLVADGEDNVIWTLQRSDGKILGSTGHNGRNAGQFHWIHQIAADSAGTLYTGEVDTGKRIQRFVIAKE